MARLRAEGKERRGLTEKGRRAEEENERRIRACHPRVCVHISRALSLRQTKYKTLIARCKTRRFLCGEGKRDMDGYELQYDTVIHLYTTWVYLYQDYMYIKTNV